MTVHPHTVTFAAFAEEYEQGRPGYPPELLEWINARQPLTSTSVVVDLGAGTGKLTRLLATSPARVVAIEPVEGMRSVFRRLLPEIELIDAPAEEMPLASGSVDLVACGQSFKWFANSAALGEIARVLRIGGELVIAFNGWDPDQPVQAQLLAIQLAAERENAEPKPGADWREVLAADSRFEVCGERTFSNSHVADRAGLLDRLRSSSLFARLPAARQEELIGELEALIEGDEVDLTHFTQVVALRRVAPVPPARH